MIYITGDTHRDFSRLDNIKFNKDDMLIILGDAGINYCLNGEDNKFKEYLKKYNVKMFCIRGNHMDTIYNKVKGKHYDVVLTHTCPLKYEPEEVFMSGKDQSKVDKSMEHFLNKVEEKIKYDKWYCGHYHTEKIVDKLKFMFDSVKQF